MLTLPKPAVYQTTKCTATLGQMPHLAANHTPSKHKPWTTLLAQAATHRVDLILPEDVFLSVEEKLGGIAPSVHWRVTAGLGALLEGGFYVDFVKTGEILDPDGF